VGVCVKSASRLNKKVKLCGGMGDFEYTVDYVSNDDGCPFDIAWLDCAWDMLDWLKKFILGSV
jgi:hypothetical protein